MEIKEILEKQNEKSEKPFFETNEKRDKDIIQENNLELGGFDESLLRKETIIKDFTESDEVVKKTEASAPSGKIASDDVVVSSDSLIYIVFKHGISGAIYKIIGKPSELEDLWMDLRGKYYHELIERGEIKEK